MSTIPIAERVPPLQRALHMLSVRAGVTRSMVAQEVGISTAYVTLLASGQRRPSRAVADRISEVLGLPVETLFPDL